MLTPHDLRRAGFDRTSRAAVFWGGRVFERFLYQGPNREYYALVDGSLVLVARRSLSIADFVSVVCLSECDFVRCFNAGYFS